LNFALLVFDWLAKQHLSHTVSNMVQDLTSHAESNRPKLRVRCARHYFVPFVIDVGQRNATFIKRPLTPLRRLFAWADAFALLPEPDYDVIHTINAVPLLTKRPYIITFESYLPRVPEDRYIEWLDRWLQKRLLSSQCVALIAMSDYARRQFRWQNRNSLHTPALEAKMRVIYPAISPRRKEPKKASSKLKLLFVGKDFMRKGGPALLRAHTRLRQQGIPVETIIVSALRWTADNYIGPPSEAYVEKEIQRLSQDGVVHYQTLPNTDVLRLMEEADFFVSPTFHDTFGFAQLEALACGTPVIATNTCAQPEIVEDMQCGYLLPFENEANVGKWIWMNRKHDTGYLDAYDRTIAQLSETIVEKLITHWESRSNYEAMSCAALERVQSRFAKQIARDQLEKLYELCQP
jgi:glycosyltransferase involved in cell wall biosynthesis